jgi:hypothetical protein
MIEPITINFQLEWSEYHAAAELLRHTRYLLAPERAIGGLVLIGSVAWFFIGDLDLRSAFTFTAGLAVIFGAPLFRRLARQQHWRTEPFYQAPTTFTFSEGGIHFVMGRVESSLDWKYYQRFLETPDAFIFVYAKKAISLFPKRAFADERQLAEFRDLVRQKLERVGE